VYVLAVMKTNGPSAAAAAAAAAVAGILARPPRRATPETLSLDSMATQQPTAGDTERSHTAPSQVESFIGCLIDLHTQSTTAFESFNAICRG